MLSIRRSLVWLPLASLVAMSSLAAGGGSWLHVRVDDAREGADINLNLPLALAHLALEQGELRARVGLDDEREMARIREIWSQLRSAPDGRFITVDDGSDHVRVSRVAGELLVEIDEQSGGRVRARVPVSVVDALFARDDELDLQGALMELEKYGASDLVTVDDDATQVRIWVDAIQ